MTRNQRSRSAKCALNKAGGVRRAFEGDDRESELDGICPGNNESAGKRKSGKTRKGNAYGADCGVGALKRRASR